MPEIKQKNNAVVADLIGRLGRATHCLQFAEGLNPAQWEALRYLARANRYSRSPSALAEFLGTTKGTASQTVRALEAKGYVRRGRAGRDRRAVALDLTDTGERLLGRDPIQRIEAAAALLPDGVGDAMAQGIGALMARLQSDCGGRAFGACKQCGHMRASAERDGAPRCGLTGDALSEAERRRLCADFLPDARLGAPPFLRPAPAVRR